MEEKYGVVETKDTLVIRLFVPGVDTPYLKDEDEELVCRLQVTTSSVDWMDLEVYSEGAHEGQYFPHYRQELQHLPEEV